MPLEFDDLRAENGGQSSKKHESKSKGILSLPETPNIDQLKVIFNKLKSQDPNSTETSSFGRANVHDLCQWTRQILIYLPNVNESPENQTKNDEIINHFKIISHFYRLIKDSGVDPSPEIEAVFNALQIYESVISIAFVICEEHPQIISDISGQVSRSISLLKSYNSQGCLALFCCGATVLSQFKSVLSALDRKIGELGIVRIAEFISNILEVFCTYLHIDLTDMSKIVSMSEAIQKIAQTISSKLKPLLGTGQTLSSERKKKWSPLELTEALRRKLSKFEQKSPIVERTVDSFEKLFKSIELVDSKFEQSIELKKVNIHATSSSASENKSGEDLSKIQSDVLLAQAILSKEMDSLEHVNRIGHFFQHLETVLTYGILIFSNEDQILNPILDNIDECTRILAKFNGLHVVYKIICGKNYLSKLKAVVKNILQLLEDSHLKLNSPSEFLAEFKKTYPNLLTILLESFLDSKKQKFRDVFESFELDEMFSKLKNKFRTSNLDESSTKI